MPSQPTFIDRGPTTLWKVACMICAILAIISLVLGVYSLHEVMGKYTYWVLLIASSVAISTRLQRAGLFLFIKRFLGVAKI